MCGAGEFPEPQNVRKNAMSTGKRIWIRADANEQIASGHLARTLSIACELRTMGAEVRFVLADDKSREWFLALTKKAAEEKNWRVCVLGIPYGMPERELPLLATLAKEERPDWILVDSYAVSPDWFSKLRKALWDDEKTCSPCLAFIDDERAFDPDVDLVINYDPDSENLERFYHTASVRLLGPQYAPLREQFADRRLLIRPAVRKILISTGGTDPFGMAEKLFSILSGLLPALNFAFLAPGHPRVEKVADLLTDCDLAVSAAGTTLYELCACGVPTLAFSMADNQTLFARQMAEEGAVTYLGDVRDGAVREELAGKVTDWVLARSSGDDPESGLRLREQEALRMHALTDGLGSRRIAKALLET